MVPVPPPDPGLQQGCREGPEGWGGPRQDVQLGSCREGLGLLESPAPEGLNWAPQSPL